MLKNLSIDNLHDKLIDDLLPCVYVPDTLAGWLVMLENVWNRSELGRKMVLSRNRPSLSRKTQTVWVVLCLKMLRIAWIFRFLRIFQWFERYSRFSNRKFDVFNAKKDTFALNWTRKVSSRIKLNFMPNFRESFEPINKLSSH